LALSESETSGKYVFSAPTKNGPGARDLGRRIAGTADSRWVTSRPLRQPTFLRTKVRAPFARAATTLNRYSGKARGMKSRMAQSNKAPWAPAARQVEEIRAAPCGGLFPLTPALSLGERVLHSPRGEQSRPLGSPLRDARCFLSLGERIKVRGNGASYSRISGPFLELSNSTSPPAEPEVS
jgi:hypothetical protein